jgi:hypothetical protein
MVLAFALGVAGAGILHLVRGGVAHSGIETIQ